MCLTPPHESEAKRYDSEAKSHDSEAKSHDSEAKSHEPEATIHQFEAFCWFYNICISFLELFKDNFPLTIVD